MPVERPLGQQEELTQIIDAMPNSGTTSELSHEMEGSPDVQRSPNGSVRCKDCWTVGVIEGENMTVGVAGICNPKEGTVTLLPMRTFGYLLDDDSKILQPAQQIRWSKIHRV